MTPEAGQIRQGFVYVALIDSGPMAQAEVGGTVRIPGRGPPWIAVDHQLSSVVVTRWPGRLWSVEIVDAVTKKDGAPDLNPDAGYTRAAAVKIMYAVPVAHLFGDRGAKVCAVIDVATELTVARATRLAAMRHHESANAQTRVWRSWLVHQNIPIDRYRDLDGTLAIGASRAGSPIGQGLRVIHNVVGRRAEALTGPSVWLVDEADPEGAWLAEPWSSASVTLLDAALAYGAPNHVGREDFDILTAAWRDVIGTA